MENQIKHKTEQKPNHMEDYNRGPIIHEKETKKKKNKNTTPQKTQREPLELSKEMKAERTSGSSRK